MYLCVSVWDIGMNDIVLAKKIAHDILEGQTISIDGLSIQKYKIYHGEQCSCITVNHTMHFHPYTYRQFHRYPHTSVECYTQSTQQQYAALCEAILVALSMRDVIRANTEQCVHVWAGTDVTLPPKRRN